MPRPQDRPNLQAIPIRKKEMFYEELKANQIRRQRANPITSQIPTPRPEEGFYPEMPRPKPEFPGITATPIPITPSPTQPKYQEQSSAGWKPVGDYTEYRVPLWSFKPAQSHYFHQGQGGTKGSARFVVAYRNGKYALIPYEFAREILAAQAQTPSTPPVTPQMA
jgi:hypothetical protein